VAARLAGKEALLCIGKGHAYRLELKVKLRSTAAPTFIKLVHTSTCRHCNCHDTVGGFAVRTRRLMSNSVSA
jgi:hypothetical protein